MLAEWLVDTAARMRAIAAQSTSIPGVAQRTGATTYYVEVFPVPRRELGGTQAGASASTRCPARSTCSSRPSCSRPRARSATAWRRRERTLRPHLDQPHADDGREDAARRRPRRRRATCSTLVRAHSRERQVLRHGRGRAREPAPSISAVLFGAIAGSGVLPLRARRRARRRSARRRQGRRREPARLRGGVRHRLGDARRAARGRCRVVAATGAAARRAPLASRADGTASTPHRAFPADVRELVALGHARVLDYQDRRYAELYLDRLAPRPRRRARRRSGRRARPRRDTRETARWLALWMAFDDVVRVADLKTPRQPVRRVARRGQGRRGDVVRVVRPLQAGRRRARGAAAARLAAALVRWDRRRVARGREPFALPLKIAHAHACSASSSLRALAATARAAPARQPLRRRAGDDRALARRRRRAARRRPGRSATRSPCAAA